MTQSAIKDLLKDEVRCSDELLELLYKEREALTGNDPDIVRQIATDKQETARQLEYFSRQRNEALARQGFGVDTDALDNAIEASQDTGLKALRDKLLVVLEQCKKQNQINGSILDGSQRGIRKALDILRGQTGSTETYNKVGIRTHQTQTSTLTKA
jgi:flagellar biosynthesis/type III secretory pathway chaperone